MDKKTLTSLFAEGLFQIPDYQRGYAWEGKQWNDFVQDIDALVEDEQEVTGHYTGTVVVYRPRDPKKEPYGVKRLPIMDVVDGQQRLTTCCLYLSIILHALVNKGETAYADGIPEFLYSGARCKVTLANATENLFYDLLKAGRSNTTPSSPHEKRLAEACTFFQKHIEKQIAERGALGVEYLKSLHDAITQKLNFTFYPIEEECEIGMTFEVMNSRGKDLSILELLKNYLMHWVSRNERNQAERDTLTAFVNKSWKDTYANLGACGGDEDQCLRIAWTLLCDHSPKNWLGYDGFKDESYIPLRNFSKTSKADVKAFLQRFTEGLAELSGYYARVVSPTSANATSHDEYVWLTKIHHAGNVANFLPLMVAARRHREAGKVSDNDYIGLLKALECFAYRVFLYSGRRSNAGKSSFHRWAWEIFWEEYSIREVTSWVYELTRHYAPEKAFHDGNAEIGDWYSGRHLLKYRLYGYELNLLDTEGHGNAPRLKWEELSDSTIEHILPQTPEVNSHWKAVWCDQEFNACLHDIGNLVLTRDNASYKNFEFKRKKGVAGQGPSYRHSDIRQERKIASFPGWTPKEFAERREQLVTWINERWKTQGGEVTAPLEVDDEADVDGVEAQRKTKHCCRNNRQQCPQQDHQGTSEQPRFLRQDVGAS
jgi:hypothetical protein